MFNERFKTAFGTFSVFVTLNYGDTNIINLEFARIHNGEIQILYTNRIDLNKIKRIQY